MTAAPDSALLPVLAALEPFAKLAEAMDRDAFIPQPDAAVWTFGVGDFSAGDLRRAREAHALIQAAIKQHNGEKV